MKRFRREVAPAFNLIRRLTQVELEGERSRRPGLIPVAFRSAQAELLWLDLDDFHCREGFFSESLALYAQQRGEARQGFLSSFEALFSPTAVDDCLPPNAFIFHAGRCGSTLLAKSLARSPGTILFSEAALHNQIWKVPEAQSPEAYRRLILSMGRRRRPAHRFHAIKFTSFNILKYRLIREAFPEVPALFLYREPGAMLASYRQGAPGWMGRDAGVGEVWGSPEEAIGAFYRAALATEDSAFRTLDYGLLQPAALPAIVDFFGMDVPEEEVRDMAEEFGWDAKSGLTPKPFLRPKREIPPAPAVLTSLYDALTRHLPLLSTRTPGPA
jgi:hypothetical protein